MDCLVCKNLKRAFETKLCKYVEALSAPFYRVSRDLAAKKNVDMERAKNDLEEHQLACVSVLQRGVKSAVYGGLAAVGDGLVL